MRRPSKRFVQRLLKRMLLMILWPAVEVNFETLTAKASSLEEVRRGVYVMLQLSIFSEITHLVLKKI